MSLKKNISIVLLIFSFSTVSKAQEIITTTGGFNLAGNSSLSWTVGEPVTETISNGSSTLTQGFQQSKLIISTEIMEPEKNFEMYAYPNPSNEYIVLQVEKTDGHSYKLYDLNGKVLIEKKIEGTHSIIYFNYLPYSTYFLTIEDKNRKRTTIKIIKL